MRKLFLAVSFCMLLGLTACGSDEKVISDNSQNVAQDSTEDKQQSESSKEEKEKVNGYVFTYNDVQVQIDEDVTGYVEQLGEPASYYESPSCAFDNLDKFYTYQGFEIDTYYAEEKDLVLAVVLLDDTVSTTEGVCIGDSQDKVISVYGEPTEKTDNSATYKKDDMKLVFIFQDDAVAAIEYKSLVLDVE